MSSTTQLLTQKIVGSESSTPPQSLTLQQEYLLKRQTNFISSGNTPTRLLDTPVFFQKTDGTNYQGVDCQDSNYLDLLNGDFSELFGECRIKTFVFRVSNFDGSKALQFQLLVNGKSVFPTGTSGTITGEYNIGSGTRIFEKGLLYISQVGAGQFSTVIGTLTAGAVNDLEIVINLESMVKLFHNP